MPRFVEKSYFRIVFYLKEIRDEGKRGKSQEPSAGRSPVPSFSAANPM